MQTQETQAMEIGRQIEAEHLDSTVRTEIVKQQIQRTNGKVVELKASVDKMERDLKLETQRDREISNKEYTDKLSDLKTDLTYFKTEHDKKITEIETRHSNEIKRMETQIERSNKEYQDKIADLTTQHAEKIDQIETKHSRKIDEIEKKHSDELTELKKMILECKNM